MRLIKRVGAAVAVSGLAMLLPAGRATAAVVAPPAACPVVHRLLGTKVGPVGIGWEYIDPIYVPC